VTNLAVAPTGAPRFYLGCPEPAWLEQTDVRLFVSDHRLGRRRSLPRARGPWALDSGGFTELQTFGRWTVGAAEYAGRVRRYRDEVGGLEWAAPQDWMCEPAIIEGGFFRPFRFVGTHLSVLEHQRRTVANLCELRSIAPDLPWAPVLQGFELADYARCIVMYGEAGIDLAAEPVVGLGSVCRREATEEIREIVTAMNEAGIRNLHGFGVKAGGLEGYGHLLASADSMAWSYIARREKIRMPGHTHQNCASCLPFALGWRARIVGGEAPAIRDSPALVTKLPAAPAGAVAPCESCGGSITARPTGRRARHCSQACRQRAYRARANRPDVA